MSMIKTSVSFGVTREVRSWCQGSTQACSDAGMWCLCRRLPGRSRQVDSVIVDLGIDRSPRLSSRISGLVWYGSDKLKECVHGDDYINGCRLLAMAGSVTPCGALVYSWSKYIIKVSILTNYDKCCVREHLLFRDVHVSTCQARAIFVTIRT
jgi:hypothetical protein